MPFPAHLRCNAGTIHPGNFFSPPILPFQSPRHPGLLINPATEGHVMVPAFGALVDTAIRAQENNRLASPLAYNQETVLRKAYADKLGYSICA